MLSFSRIVVKKMGLLLEVPYNIIIEKMDESAMTVAFMDFTWWEVDKWISKKYNKRSGISL